MIGVCRKDVKLDARIRKAAAAAQAHTEETEESYSSGAGLGVCRLMTPGFFRPVRTRAINVKAHKIASEMTTTGGSSSSSISTMTHPKNRPIGSRTRSCVRTKLFQSGPAHHDDACNDRMHPVAGHTPTKKHRVYAFAVTSSPTVMAELHSTACLDRSVIITSRWPFSRCCAGNDRESSIASHRLKTAAAETENLMHLACSPFADLCIQCTLVTAKMMEGTVKAS